MGHPEALIVFSGNNPVQRTKSLQINVKFGMDNDSLNEKTSDRLDTKSKELTVFPCSGLANNLSHINIDNSNISELPIKISEQLPMLKVFTANGNELSVLPNDFGELSYLQELCLCDNKLISLPEQLSNLTKLRVLKLNANCLVRLHSEIGYNKSLEVLSVNQNKLKRFPATLGLLTNLCVLEAKCNVLQSLPSTFNYLKSLRVIDLSNNRLTCIPESFGALECLTHIDLSENKIDHLCETFLSSRTLQHLCLDHNAFSTCPCWFQDLENVVEIRMKCNELSDFALPEGFGLRTNQLKILDLRGNSIQKLPCSFGHNISLESLFLGTPVSYLEKNAPFKSGNWLNSLPSNFAGLICLVQLHLEDCQLRNLPEDIGKLLHLEDVFLGSNILSELPSSFTKLVALKRCQLSKNRLVNLPDDIGALEMLTELYLDYNKLKTLPASMKNLTSLELLDVSNNKLKQWPSDIVSAITRLQSLNLYDNRFPVPDCDIPNIVRRMHVAEQDDDCDWRGRKLYVLTTSQCLEEAHPCGTGQTCNNDSRAVDPDYINVEDGCSEQTCSSCSSYGELPDCQKDPVEFWDIDSEHDNTESCLGAGQFDLDDDGPVMKTGPPAGNCYLAVHLDMYRHLSTPYLYHTPTMRSFLYERHCEVPGQFDDDLVSGCSNDSHIAVGAVSEIAV